jgi:hypothetical protein
MSTEGIVEVLVGKIKEMGGGSEGGKGVKIEKKGKKKK